MSLKSRRCQKSQQEYQNVSRSRNLKLPRTLQIQKVVHESIYEQAGGRSIVRGCGGLAELGTCRGGRRLPHVEGECRDLRSVGQPLSPPPPWRLGADRMRASSSPTAWRWTPSRTNPYHEAKEAEGMDRSLHGHRMGNEVHQEKG